VAIVSDNPFSVLYYLFNYHRHSLHFIPEARYYMYNLVLHL